MKLNVVLRTCDKKSIQGDRIVPKEECVISCVTSLIRSLRGSGVDFLLHVIDDNSSNETKEKLKFILPEATFNFLEPREENHLNSKQKSRISVKIQYEYINSLPNEDLVYVVEDDYLHYPDSIKNMILSWEYFSLLFPRTNIGIFPQDFNQMYLHPQNMFNSTYVEPCTVLPGPDRYFRTTWFTHESFMVRVELIKKYKEEFEKLMTIGYEEGAWEGNTISNVWNKPDVMMLMPLGTMAIHLGCQKDISFYAYNWQDIYNENKYFERGDADESLDWDKIKEKDEDGT